MRALRALINRARGEDGASAVEYGILITGVAVVIIVGVVFFTRALDSSYDDSCNNITAQTGQTGC